VLYENNFISVVNIEIDRNYYSSWWNDKHFYRNIILIATIQICNTMTRILTVHSALNMTVRVSFWRRNAKSHIRQTVFGIKRPH